MFVKSKLCDMKKGLIILLSLFMIANISFAQNNFGYLELSGGATRSLEPAVSIKGIFSHYKNHHFAIGGGLGFSYVSHTLNDDNFGIPLDNKGKDFSLEIPIFLNIRGNILKKEYKVTPYYSVSAGYIYPLKKAVIEYSYTVNNIYNVVTRDGYNKGLYFAPEIGISYKRLPCGLEGMYGMSDCENNTRELYDYNAGAYISTQYLTTEVPNLIFSFKITGRL